MRLYIAAIISIVCFGILASFADEKDRTGTAESRPTQHRIGRSKTLKKRNTT